MLVTMEQAQAFQAEDALTSRAFGVGEAYALATGGARAGDDVVATLAKAGADFRVERVPLFTSEGEGVRKVANKGRMGTEVHYSGAPFYGVRRVGAGGALFQVVGAQYRPLQNAEGASILEPLVDAGVVSLDGALVLRAGGMVVVRGKVNGAINVKGDRDGLQAYFNIAIPHDGTLALNAYLTTVRPVCENTLAAGLFEARRNGERISIRHTTGAAARVEVAKGLAQKGVQAFQAFGVKANRLAALPMGDRAFGDVLARFLPAREKDGELVVSAQTAKARDVVRGIWEGGTVGERGTAWAALNALTEYADHHTRVQAGDLDKREVALKRVDSALFGAAADLKREAASIILDVVGELV